VGVRQVVTSERTANRIRCPRYECQCPNTKVVDKHYRKRDGAIVRRHQCAFCGHRFTSEQRVSKAA
jgi:transcriptional regulator NrdR family protein